MVEPFSQTITQMSNKDYIELIIQALTALGTILLAIIAVFGEQIRRWLLKPKIQLTVGESSPYIAISRSETRGDSATSTTSVTATIKIKVINMGSSSAQSFIGLIEAIFSKRSASTTFYKSKALPPSRLPWNNDTKEFTITPKIPFYLEVARIEKFESLSSDVGGIEPPSSEYGLSISIEESKGEYTHVGKGTFIIPITIYADNINPMVKFLEIFWNGTVPDDIQPSNFYIKLLKENEVPNEVKKDL